MARHHLPSISKTTWLKKLEKGAGITAVAAIVEHNTSGIISRKSDNVSSPKDLVGKKYGTWNDPTELAMLKTLVESQGGDFEKVEKVPNNDSNSITPIANGVLTLLGSTTVGMVSLPNRKA